MDTTGQEEHRRIEEALGAYLVGGLDGQETTRIRRHLEQCDQCRNIVDSLEGLNELLEAASLAEDPPPELEDRIVSAIVTGSGEPTEPAWAISAQTATATSAASRRFKVSISTLVAAAVVIALVAIAVNNQIGRGRRSVEEATTPSGVTASPSNSFRLVAAEELLPSSPQALPSEGMGPKESSVPTARSTASDVPATTRGQISRDPVFVGGDLFPKKVGASWECDITVWGLQPGQLYEVWFKGRTGVYSGGTFRVDSGGIATVTVSTGLSFADLEEIVISAEPDDGNPLPNGEAVLKADLASAR